MGVDLSRQAAESRATEIDGAFLSRVSLEYETENFVRLEL